MINKIRRKKMRQVKSVPKWPKGVQTDKIDTLGYYNSRSLFISNIYSFLANLESDQPGGGSHIKPS